MYVDSIAFIEDHTAAKALIKKAHDVIHDGGWVQGAYEFSGGHCLVGALLGASENFSDIPFDPLNVPNDVFVAADLLAAAIGLEPEPELPLGDEHPRLSTIRLVETWNDDPLRTKRQVLAVMKKAYA